MYRVFLKIFAVLTFMLISSLSIAAAASNFVQGQDYQLISTPSNLPTAYQLPTGKIQVIEFFSYGCPACNHFEPGLEKWLVTKPANVEFIRIPVIFEQGWDVYAKSYYIAQALGVEKTMTPLIFNAIHQQGLNLSSENAMQGFFAQHGTKANEFAGAYNYSTTIALQLNQAALMMQTYQVLEIPTVIVNGKYKVSAGMVNGNANKMIQIINYLIQLSAKSPA